MGGIVFAGYKLNNGLNIRFNYNFGLSNLDPNPDASAKI